MVPDEIVVAMLRERGRCLPLRVRFCALDGFPRTVSQALALDKMLHAKIWPCLCTLYNTNCRAIKLSLD